jgi:fructokinase
VAGHRVGIDLGGTKIEGIALAAAGAPLARRRIATPRGDYAGTVEAVAGLVEALEHEVGRHGTVGVGIPGTISKASGRVKNANSTWLNGEALDRDLAARLKRPVRVANDADCFALSEAADGAAAGADPVFGAILGAGVGGGIVIAGRPLIGVNGIAGEWGHNPLPWLQADELPGPECWCGQRGCIEAWLSGPGLARDYANNGGAEADATEIARRAEAGERAAVDALARYEDRLARALASVINVVDPEVIVLGGGLSNLERLYGAVPARWSTHVFSDRVDTRLVRAQHGDASGVRGAAWLWTPEEAEASP